MYATADKHSIETPACLLIFFQRIFILPSIFSGVRVFNRRCWYSVIHKMSLRIPYSFQDWHLWRHVQHASIINIFARWIEQQYVVWVYLYSPQLAPRNIRADSKDISWYTLFFFFYQTLSQSPKSAFCDHPGYIVSFCYIVIVFFKTNLTLSPGVFRQQIPRI